MSEQLGVEFFTHVENQFSALIFQGRFQRFESREIAFQFLPDLIEGGLQ